MCSASPAWGRGWLCVGALVTRPCWRSLVPGFALELVTQRESGHNPSIIPIFFPVYPGFWHLPDQDGDVQDKALGVCAPHARQPPWLCPSCSHVSSSPWQEARWGRQHPTAPLLPPNNSQAVSHTAF